MQVQSADKVGARMDSTLECALSGNQEVLGQILSRYTGQLYRTAFRVLGSREEAEDAVQDALLSAVQNLTSFEGRSKLSTWLTRVVVNAALMRRRKLRPCISASIDQESPDGRGLSLASRIADPRPDPEEAYAQQEQATMVRQWLEALPASYRSALWLRDVEGMTTQEAADELRVSEGTLKSRLHRARSEFSRRVHGTATARFRMRRTGCRGLEKRPLSEFIG
jgi:RNA polymerase sigma-70 factor, ECF subfamily